MRRVKALVILPVAAFHLPIVPWRKRPDDFVADPVHFQVLLEESGFFSVSSKTVGKFCPIVCLDAFDGAGEGFQQMLYEQGGGIGIMFLKSLHKAPSGVFINGCVLVELLSDYLAVFQTDRRDKFYVYLNPLSGIIHLFIGFRDILWIWRMNGHNALFSKKSIKSGNGSGIPALPELKPENDQSGIRITSADISDQPDLFGSMLIGMMEGTSGAVPKGVPGAIIAAFPTINILSVGFIFNSGFGNAKFLSVLDKG